MWTYIVLLLGICLRNLELCSKDATAFWPPDFILCFNFSAFVKILFYNLTFSVVISLTQSGILLWLGFTSPGRLRMLPVFSSAFWQFMFGEMSVRRVCLALHYIICLFVSCFIFFYEDFIFKNYFLGRAEAWIPGLVHPRWALPLGLHPQCTWYGCPGRPEVLGPLGLKLQMVWAAQWVLGTEPRRAISKHC